MELLMGIYLALSVHKWYGNFHCFSAWIVPHKIHVHIPGYLYILHVPVLNVWMFALNFEFPILYCQNKDLISEQSTTCNHCENVNCNSNCRIHEEYLLMIISTENKTGRFINNICEDKQKLETFDWSNCYHMTTHAVTENRGKHHINYHDIDIFSSIMLSALREFGPWCLSSCQ
jgi:hypothetical protein